ncbi:protein FRIGIDA [Euphorbia lathyris]|uniref:protein FRIGIDA n=1 Tax=Euphorbia lathyris TaxID=212925 RepID=UPI003313B585
MAKPFNSNLHDLPLSLVKQELPSDSTSPMQRQSPPSLPQHLAALSQVKGEPLELSLVPSNPFEQQQGAQEPIEPQFFKSIDQLGNLSSFINEFHSRFVELKKHLDFIQTAIDARFNEQQQQKQIQSTPAIAPPPMSNSTAKLASTEAAITKTKKAAPPKSELMSLCEMMCGRGLRKYLTSNLSNIRELRAQVPSALKCAREPAKLVLECIGRFYLQGTRAYAKDSPMVPGRKASILILELFLLVINNDVQLASSVKQEAEQAAIAWRKRLKAEGGISKACEADAKGLLLFVGCYGIPKVFTNEDVWHLVRLSNPKQIADSLRRSHVLVKRISDILERMMSNGMKIEAVDVANAFGIEDKFPPQKILSSYLRDTKEALKRRKRDGSNSPTLMKEASEKQLATLKSVMKFLEDRKLDPVKLLSGWKIREKIDVLEKEIADLNEKIDERVTAKRKANEKDFLNNLKNQEAKRLRFAGSPLISSPSLGLHDQMAPRQVDGNGLYGASIRLNLPDGGFSGHINNSVVGSMMHGSSSFSTAYGSVPSTSSYAGGRTELLVDQTGRTSSYVGGRTELLVDPTGRTSSYVGGRTELLVDPTGRTSSYVGGRTELLLDATGQKIGSGGLSYGWHGVGDASGIDRSVRQSFVYQPVSGLMGQPAAIEGFAGLPNSPPMATNRSSTSDLYRFADAVK